MIAGIVGAIAVVLALVIGGVVIATSGSDDEDGDPEAKPSPSAPPTEGAPEDDPPTGPEDGPQSGGPESGPDAEMTPASGVVLPLLDGWSRSPGLHGASVNGESYACPGDKPERCVRAGSIVLNATGSGSVKSVATRDVPVNAKQSYSEEFYGGITSHEEVASEKVEVAGEDGYRVRWKIDNEVDPDAYVESVAFPHPDGSGQMLVVRTGFDIHDDAPPLGDMDRLVEGIKEGTISEDDGSSERV